MKKRRKTNANSESGAVDESSSGAIAGDLGGPLSADNDAASSVVTTAVLNDRLSKEDAANHSSFVFRLRHSAEKLPRFTKLELRGQGWLSKLVLGRQVLNRSVSGNLFITLHHSTQYNNCSSTSQFTVWYVYAFDSLWLVNTLLL